LASASPDMQVIDNSKIKDAQKSISKILEIKKPVLDKNETNNTLKTALDNNKTKKEIKKEIVADKKIEQKDEQKKPEKKIVKKQKIKKVLKLLPKNKIWAGYINIKTNQKYQKVFKKTFAFDTKKDWLLLFGPGTVKLEIDGVVKKFRSKQNMRFKYIDGVLTKIDIKEFKSLNKGRKW
jgi:hypothetical protein